MPITALPTPPSPADTPAEFNSKAFNLLGALPTFVTEANALETNVNAKEASATTAAANALTSETAADASEAAALAHKNAAATSEANALAHKNAAATSETNAAASAAAAAASYDAFDDRFLGAKANDPALDNDGNALIVGALYFNSSVGQMRVWDGLVWAAAGATLADGSVTTAKLADDAVSFAKAQNIATSRLLGRVTAGAGNIEELTPEQALTTILNGGQLAGMRNKLINGSAGHNQRGATSVADDNYCLDRFYVLTESGSVTVEQITDPESGAPWAIRLTQPDAVAKRIGLAQIVESGNIRALRSAAVNLSARVKPSFAGNVRYAIIEHTGTADLVTSDVVNNWASATFTPGNFFIAGLTILKTGVIAPGAATYGSLSDWVALGAGTNNVIVFVWSEAAVAQNGTLELNRVQLEPGIVATPFEHRPYGMELALCRRYLPAHNSNGTTAFIAGGGFVSSATIATFVIPHDVPPRVPPTGISVSNASHFTINAAVGGGVAATVVFQDASLSATRIVATQSGMTAGQVCQLYFNNAAGQLLLTGCEL